MDGLSTAVHRRPVRSAAPLSGSGAGEGQGKTRGSPNPPRVTETVFIRYLTVAVGAATGEGVRMGAVIVLVGCTWRYEERQIGVWY